jgi:hypothetical protein
VTAGEVVILAGTYDDAEGWRFRMRVEGNPDAEHAVLLPRCVYLGDWIRGRIRRITRAYVTPVVREAMLYRSSIPEVRGLMAATPGADADVIYLEWRRPR